MMLPSLTFLVQLSPYSLGSPCFIGTMLPQCKSHQNPYRILIVDDFIVRALSALFQSLSPVPDLATRTTMHDHLVRNLAHSPAQA